MATSTMTAPRLHRLQHVAGDELWRAGAGDEYGADHDVSCENFFLYRGDAGIAGPGPALEQLVQLAQARDRAVEDRDLRAEPDAMRAACVPTTPPPSTTTRAGSTPGTPPSNSPRPPADFLSDAPAASIDSRPATSLIGARSGRPPRSSVTVS
jgi:hypothetical protein